MTLLLTMTQIRVRVLPALMEVHVWFLALPSPASVQLDSLDNFVKQPSVRIYMSMCVAIMRVSQNEPAYFYWQVIKTKRKTCQQHLCL